MLDLLLVVNDLEVPASPELVLRILSVQAQASLRASKTQKNIASDFAFGLRAILPVPSVMQVLDVVLPFSLEPHLSELFPPVLECFIGARPKHSV